MAEPITLLPHQNPITGMNLHAPTGVSKGANEEVRQFIESLARVALKTASPQEAKAIFDSIKPSAEAAGYGDFLANAFGMTANHDTTPDERAAINRGIDDMINQRIANDGRVAEVYAKLRAIQNVNPPSTVDRVFAKLKGK